MEFIKGELIICSAGRENGRLMCVTDFDGKFVYIADGRERRLEKPKRKNPRHIRKTNKRLTAEDMNTDKALRKALLREV